MLLASLGPITTAQRVSAVAIAPPLPGPDMPAPALPPIIVAPWYKTPVGIIAILASAFVGYKLLSKPKK